MSELRKFGFIFSGYYFLIALLVLHHRHALSPVVWLILSFLLMFAIVSPVVLKPIKFVWDGVLRVLSYVNTRILFGVIFFGLFTPIALIRKLLKKDALQLQYDVNATTYRVDCRAMENDLRRPY